ncbi:MAG: hypothetical protein ACXVHM_07250 [Methanobacterium sp.]
MESVEILRKEIEILKDKSDDLNTCDGTLEKLQDEIGALIEELEEINQYIDIKLRYLKACHDLSE